MRRPSNPCASISRTRETRRAGGRSIAARAAAALVLAGAIGPFGTAAQAPAYETTEVADGVYRFRWQSHHAFFVVGRGAGGPEVLVVDPISTVAAARLATEIEAAAPGARLVAIVYSHHHADHATGAPVLREAFGGRVPIVAHENAAPPLITAADPALPPPTVTFANRAALVVGDRRVELRYLGPNHSDNSVVTLVPDAGVAFAVDFVAHDRVGYRDLPDWHFPGHFRSLARLLELDFDTIVFGHGPDGDRSSVLRQIAYYDDLRVRVADAVAAGSSEDQAAATVRSPAYSDWGGYGDWYALNVRGMYRWLASREP